MSDECLMTLETMFSFYTQYQAVMRKFTLARKAVIMIKTNIITNNFINGSTTLLILTLVKACDSDLIK